jgi:hypothetical protein
VVLLGSLSGACFSRTPPPSQQVIPIYSKQSGRLEALMSDRDGDGKLDTRALMDGARLNRVEIDRNADGRPDRWEYYASAGADAPGTPLIERAEEADGPEGRITRREVYADGVIDRAEEDTDGDGRIDKWEKYANGSLLSVELDLIGAGRPSQRLNYGAGRNVASVETDPDGDGVFVPVAAQGTP